MYLGSRSDSTKQTLIVLGSFKDEVAEGMTLAVELANEHFYRNEALHVVAHVDVVCQACTCILMHVGIVGPPCKLGAVAYLEPSIDGRYEGFVELTAVDAPAVHELVGRNDSAARRIVGIGVAIAKGCAVAVELSC